MSAKDTRGTAEARVRKAREIADAVLYEGYLLYPYRASAAKNRVRWQFGVLGPGGTPGPAPGEGPEMATDCLLHGGEDAEIAVRVRFLQLQSRTVERHLGGGRFSPVAELTIDAQTWLSWDEAVDREVDVGAFRVGESAEGERRGEVRVPGGTETEHLRGTDGELLGRVVRRRRPLSASLRVSRARSEGALHTVRFSLLNEQPWPADDDPADDERSRALRYSLLSAHLTLRASGGSFVSVIDPPPWAEAAARGCRSHRLWPVLIGDERDRDVVLAAPIILYDHPRIAEQSAGDLFDSTEIDELLSLRVMTLTEEEKREARATDPRAAEIVDRCEGLSPTALDGMHASSTERVPAPRPEEDIDAVPTWAEPKAAEAAPDGPWWDPEVDARFDPDKDAVDVGGASVARGSSVLLRPGSGADAQDLFFDGRAATVAGVHHDVDGRTHVAVVLHDDPASDLHQWYGRYLYFRPDEVEPLEAREPEGEP